MSPAISADQLPTGNDPGGSNADHRRREAGGPFTIHEYASLPAEYQERTELVRAWIIDPVRRFAVVHHPDGRGERLDGGDPLCGGDVLRGFELSLAELFARL